MTSPRRKPMTEYEEAHHVIIKIMFKMVVQREEDTANLMELVCEECNEFAGSGKCAAADTLRGIMRGHFGIR
jgi:hypothetical protein